MVVLPTLSRRASKLAQGPLLIRALVASEPTPYGLQYASLCSSYQDTSTAWRSEGPHFQDH